MFALAWCEFSWAVRKLFAALGVPYRSVDLDSVELQGGDLGNRIRAVLAARTGTRTIPQVYVGGHHVGGCSEVFDALADGRLDQLLATSGLEARRPEGFDPCALLPGWVPPTGVPIPAAVAESWQERACSRSGLAEPPRPTGSRPEVAPTGAPNARRLAKCPAWIRRAWQSNAPGSPPDQQHAGRCSRSARRH